jgi:hypothetical protein
MYVEDSIDRQQHCAYLGEVYIGGRTFEKDAAGFAEQAQGAGNDEQTYSRG